LRICGKTQASFAAGRGAWPSRRFAIWHRSFNYFSNKFDAHSLNHPPAAVANGKSHSPHPPSTQFERGTSSTASLAPVELLRLQRSNSRSRFHETILPGSLTPKTGEPNRPAPIRRNHIQTGTSQFIEKKGRLEGMPAFPRFRDRWTPGGPSPPRERFGYSSWIFPLLFRDSAGRRTVGTTSIVVASRGEATQIQAHDRHRFPPADSRAGGKKSPPRSGGLDGKMAPRVPHTLVGTTAGAWTRSEFASSPFSPRLSSATSIDLNGCPLPEQPTALRFPTPEPSAPAEKNFRLIEGPARPIVRFDERTYKRHSAPTLPGREAQGSFGIRSPGGRQFFTTSFSTRSAFISRAGDTRHPPMASSDRRTAIAACCMGEQCPLPLIAPEDVSVGPWASVGKQPQTWRTGLKDSLAAFRPAAAAANRGLVLDSTS